MTHRDYRAYLHPRRANPEVGTPYYEQVCQTKVHGFWNCEILSLDFSCDQLRTQLIFRPIDFKMPIVLAIDETAGGSHFIVISEHLPGKRHGCMINFPPFKTTDYLLDCSSDDHVPNIPKYWSVGVNGERYVHGGVFPDTWLLHDIAPLCAFVGGGITVGELRALAYRAQQEVVKEERREDHIKALRAEVSILQGRLQGEIRDALDLLERHSSLLKGAKEILELRGFKSFAWRSMLREAVNRVTNE